MDMEFDISKKRVLVLSLIVGIIGLGITADKCRQMIGEAASSKSGKFTIFNCFDGGSGTTACLVKEGVKLYSYNIRGSHVEKARHKAIEKSLVDALTQGLAAKEAAELAQKEGVKAAKLATRKAKRIIGPIISSGWDFFEAIYYGGTVAEGALRGTGTLIGTYIVGYLGEQRFGRFGYLVGSELGSWAGGRIGLMVYDIVDSVSYLIQFVENVESVVENVENVLDEAGVLGNYETEENKVDETPVDETVENIVENVENFVENAESVLEIFESEESKVDETPVSESVEGSEDSYVYETSEDTEDGNTYESPSYDSSESHDEL